MKYLIIFFTAFFTLMTYQSASPGLVS